MRLRDATFGDLTDRADQNTCYLEPRGPIDWGLLFGNERPVEVEVGCGKGLFLSNAASQRLAHNFFAIEISRKYALFAADRVFRRGLSNARVARADASQVLRDWLPAASVSALHVYFPDPWWKRRHKKRRVFTAEFVQQASRLLIPGGELQLATDVEEYFGLMKRLVAAHASFAPIAAPAMHEPEHDLDYLTNFERKARMAGKSVFRAVYHRVP